MDCLGLHFAAATDVFGRESLVLAMTALRAIAKSHLVCGTQLIPTRTTWYDSGTRDLWWNLAIRTTLFLR